MEIEINELQCISWFIAYLDLQILQNLMWQTWKLYLWLFNSGYIDNFNSCFDILSVYIYSTCCLLVMWLTLRIYICSDCKRMFLASVCLCEFVCLCLSVCLCVPVLFCDIFRLCVSQRNLTMAAIICHVTNWSLDAVSTKHLLLQCLESILTSCTLSRTYFLLRHTNQNLLKICTPIKIY